MRARIGSAARWGVLGLMFVGGTASATISNPFPGIYGDDNGATIFQAPDLLSAIKLADPLPTFFGYDTVFGVYRVGAPLDDANTAILFGTSDAVGNQALANFLTGQTFDVDTSLLEDSFTPGTSPIGFFFIYIDQAGTLTGLYSDPALNAGGVDRFAAFPLIGSPDTLLVGFEADIPGAGLATVSFELVTPVRPVPEPASLALTAAGFVLLGCAVFARRTALLFNC
jgi:hypothetical protein